ncbi:ABC transporter permease [Paraclostridium bifermentans]|uniref:ABC transporter permease n=1 Tax=Paraclostridium TaxID=1849822 RepID=UPI00041E03D4|nr:ABC transporter permease [Paraclostridium bifermentans]MDV8113789.1 ABC transporter permease [Bacillus sp. BAU-SS-2023]MCE9676619.1 ABC transporter permease [Paraclostridium bifermentans]TQO59095.1 ABC transporter permease [Paraclostridium bifermentans]GKZ04125.1 peptide ABC transporter permease [Paraclostridium bifermentans]GKZ05319.1 peptide ABC transporter permease [Paraclostridium bifermentans]
MKEKIIKRLLNMIPMLFFITIISFILMHLAPGDPLQAYISPDMNVEDIERIRESLGLNDPIIVQYFKWLFNTIQGNLGYSMVNSKPVLDLILERLGPTILLSGSALIISIMISIPVGLISGYKKNSIIDKVLNVVSYIGISIPSFWFAMMLIYVFSIKLNIFPSVGMRTIGVDTTLDLINHLILPVTVLSFYNLSVYIRYIRSSTIEQLKQDYVTTQYAYGASTKDILFKHVLKNTLLPVITIFGMSLPSIFTGAFITETIFGWPGMGQLGVNAIFGYDYPVVMGITLFSSAMLIIGNLIADILYAMVDPRIKS